MPAALPSHDSVSRCCQMSPGAGEEGVWNLPWGREPLGHAQLWGLQWPFPQISWSDSFRKLCFFTPFLLALCQDQAGLWGS